MTTQPPRHGNGPGEPWPPYGQPPRQQPSPQPYPQQAPRPQQQYPWMNPQQPQPQPQPWPQQPWAPHRPPPNRWQRAGTRLLIAFGVTAVVLFGMGSCIAALGGGSTGITTTADATTAPAVEASTAAATEDTTSSDDSGTVTDPGGKYRILTSRQWKVIARNPAAHVGERIRVYGVVTQADAATGTDAIRADVDGRWHPGEYGYYLDYDTNTVLTGDPVADLVEDDVFRADVLVAGALDYDTTLGGSTTVPQLIVNRVKVVAHQKG